MLISLICLRVIVVGYRLFADGIYIGYSMNYADIIMITSVKFLSTMDTDYDITTNVKRES